MVGKPRHGGERFEGRIDEVAVWLRALDAAGIAALGASPVEWPPRLSAAVAMPASVPTPHRHTSPQHWRAPLRPRCVNGVATSVRDPPARFRTNHRRRGRERPTLPEPRATNGAWRPTSSVTEEPR
jgi:hypothetical protein